MAQTALLIGSDYGGLRGVGNDLAAMTAALEKRGFTTRECGPGEASRAGILAAYEQLIADAGPDDAIVVYYTGHGGFAVPSGVGAHGPAELQYIVPVDYDQSGRDDFRGIASVELSVLQARLTAVTRNVTVILDCCHSGLMSRDPSVILKAVGPAPYERVRAHLDRLEEDGLRIGLVANEGNRHAVRVVACAPEQRAYEHQGVGGDWAGVLTESLILALDEADNEPVTWADVLDRVRHRVVGLGYGQRPEVEGPSDRLLFSTEVADLLHSLPVTVLGRPDQVRLDAAALLRVQTGDEFVIMPPGMTRVEPGHRVGDLTIDAVSAMSVEGTVTFAPGRSTVPLGARAFRTKATAPRVAFKVPLDHPQVHRVLEALDEATLARRVEPGEADWTGEVGIESDGCLTLCDRIGPLHPPYPPDPRGIDDLGRAIRILAQATELRRLVGDPSYPLAADVTVEWGRVVDGVAHPLAAEGETLAAGEHVYLTVCNNSDLPVYVSLLDIGVSGRIQLVYRATPGGRRLPGGHQLTLGYSEATRTLTGTALSWPDQLDPRHARPETILVVLTSEPQSLLALELPAIAQARAAEWRGKGESRLESMFDQIATGQTRDLDSDWSTGVRYDIRAVEFEMAREPGDLPSPEREGRRR